MNADGSYDPVRFTRESARRIARVVRAAEAVPPTASPLSFEPYFASRLPRQVRAATFSGAWPIGSTKIVTFSYTPTATANVTNLSWPITDTGYVNENCIVGKDGTNWWLVVPVLEQRTAVLVTQTQQRTFCSQTGSQAVVTGVSTAGGTITSLSDVTVTASLNTSSCAITVGVTKTTASTNVVTGVTASMATVTIVSQTATAVFIAATATSSYLRLRVP